MKRVFVLLILVCSLLVFAACNKPTESQGQGPDATPEQPAEKTGLICPLDGEEINEMPVRLFAVSIDNGKNSEPQSGLDAADMVFEVPVEADITRFLALYYHAQPEKIGPVRSARHYVVPLAQGLNAVFIHCGQSYLAAEYFESNDVEHINQIGHTSGFWRDNSRVAPTNLYTSWSNLVEEVTALGWYEKAAVPDAFHFLSAEEARQAAIGSVTEIHIPYKYKKVDYVWDGKTYLRNSDGKPHTDMETGATLHADNILIQYVKTTVVSEQGHLDIDYSQGGEGLLFSKGQVKKVNWQKASAKKPLTFTDAENGKAVELVPGKTFINQVPDTLTVTYNGAENSGE